MNDERSARARLRFFTGRVWWGMLHDVVCYAALSLMNPLLLNGVPSGLVAPLIVAAVCASRVGDRP